MPGDGDRNEDGSFLSRWSRRKQEAAAERKSAEQAPPAPPDEPHQEPVRAGQTAPAAAQAAQHLDGVQTAGTPGEAAAEMVEPPSLDLIDADFDLAHWMNQNVPESWKLAALRRTWETDPFIRDYLNPARDYALDWNVPGGAPGYGPLDASDDVQALVARAFGHDGASAATATAENPQAEPLAQGSNLRLSDNKPLTGDDAAALQQEMTGPAPVSPISGADQAEAAATSGASPENKANSNVALQQKLSTQPVDFNVVSRQRRRSGGAVPT